MQLTEQQAEFVELLEAASSRVDQFVQKVMGPLVEAYGPGCLAPSRLPLDYVLNLAQLYLRLESVRQCEACRSALGDRLSRPRINTRAKNSIIILSPSPKSLSPVLHFVYNQFHLTAKPI